MYASDIDLMHVQKQLVEHFNLSEMQSLCSDLNIEYEELGGETTRSDKSRELVKLCYRLGRIAELLTRCQELRSQVVWNQPAKIYSADEIPEEWIEPLQRLYRLVKEFNRNRHQPFSDERTQQGDEIAFTMREAAPFLFNQFKVEEWLNSSNIGKRLAAIKYLSWLQDIEFLDNLLGKLISEKPFVQLHLLVTIDSMLDQLGWQQQQIVQAALTTYQEVSARDLSLEYWRKRILARLQSAQENVPTDTRK